MASKTITGTVKTGDNGLGEIWVEQRIYWDGSGSTTDIALGATTAQVRVITYFYCQYDIVDSSNDGLATIGGTNYDYNSTTIDGTGYFLVGDTTKTVTISQTSSTSVSVSGSVSNVEWINGNSVSVSGSISIAASGVPYTAFTCTTANTYYDFAPVSGNNLRINLTNGVDAEITKVKVGITTTIANTTIGLNLGDITVSTHANGTIYVPLTAAQMSNGAATSILGYWDITAKGVTRICLEPYCRQYSTGSSGAYRTPIYITPPDIDSLYSLSSFTTVRSGTNDPSTSITCTSTITALTTSPWHQRTAWPATTSMPAKISITTGGTLSATTITSINGSGTTRTYSYSDASTPLLAKASTRNYKIDLYRNTTVIDTITSMVTSTGIAVDKFLVMEKFSATQGYVGFNISNLNSYVNIKNNPIGDLSAGASLQIGESFAPNMRFSSNGIQVANAGGTYTLQLQPYGGATNIAGDLTVGGTLTAHAVNDIVVTATNSNPSSHFGGTWTLVDKHLADVRSTSTSTLNSSYVSAYTEVASVSCNTIVYTCALTTNAELTDTQAKLADINFTSLGVTGTLDNARMTAWADGNNAFGMFQIYGAAATMQLDCYDVVARGVSTATLASGTTLYFTAVFSVPYANRADAYCTKWFWKRTA